LSSPCAVCVSMVNTLADTTTNVPEGAANRVLHDGIVNTLVSVAARGAVNPKLKNRPSLDQTIGNPERGPMLACPSLSVLTIVGVSSRRERVSTQM